MSSDLTDKHWYVLRAVFRKEITVRDALRRAGFHCYVPMIYRLHIEKGHKVRRLVPAVSQLVFVYGSATAITDYKLHSKDTIYWLTIPKDNHREKMIVPDKSMDDFIRVTQQNEQSVSYFRPDELKLSKGDRILIHGGPFDGVEGVLLKVKGKREKQLLVSIPDLVIAAVSIRPDMVEVISNHVEPSHDLQHDARELISFSTRMLTSPPDRMSQAAEYDMLYQEIRRLYASLASLRGYLLSLEGQLSLSLLMAEHILQHSVSSSTRTRFLKAVASLGEQTLLAVRMQYIGGILLPDAHLLATARNTIAQWQSASPTDRQRELIAELTLFSHTNNV